MTSPLLQALPGKVLQKYAIKPVQQFAYTTGKNATDSTLIIDAMDLLYTRKFDGFCLITSDSDFTGLAMRLREEGLTVLGFGEKKTPEAFRNACHKFVFTEVLRPDTATESAAQRTKRQKMIRNHPRHSLLLRRRKQNRHSPGNLFWPHSNNQAMMPGGQI